MTPSPEDPSADAASDEFIDIFDDEGPSQALETACWNLLVVDDDAEVHEATEYALLGASILGRPLRLHHARSAAEARTLLATESQFAAILLDVVMETSDAGLRLVDHIRRDLGLSEPRIILRTGQPGYAPELQVFERYDINDYRTKSEMTRTRLITSLLAAIRSYHQLRTIAENRRGLELIVSAAADLMELRAINSFAEGVLTQIAALLNLPIDGVVCVQRALPADLAADTGLHVVGAAGHLAKYLSQPLSQMAESDISREILLAIAKQQHLFAPHHTVLYLSSGGMEGAIYLQAAYSLSPTDRSLIEVFAANISACYGNVRLVEKLNYSAFHDDLTGLANRNGFIRILDEGQESGERTVVALIDLAHFSEINDGIGHDFGNALLRAVAHRLRLDIPCTCLLARIAPDVFGVVGPAEDVNPERLLDLFRPPLRCAEHTLPLAVTIGLRRMTDQDVSGLRVLRQAYIALNQAKRNLRSVSEYFDPEMEEAPRQRLQIISDLRHAFEAQRLAVWFQPQVSLKTTAVWGMEALIRWPDGAGGFVQTPDVFIPLAEHSGLIVDIGSWVLERSCAVFQELRAAAGAPPRVAVNVSMVQFRSADFVSRVAAILGRYGVRPAEVELEITENLAMDDPKRVLATLDELKRLGVTVSLDDFGTGYSSLSHLDRLPIDSLKIDRSFVAQIGNGGGGELAETIVALGRKLGLEIIAEGIETSAQASYLRGVGCGVAQGFFFAKPMPENLLRPWLRRQSAEAMGALESFLSQDR